MFWLRRRTLPSAVVGTKVACVLRGTDVDMEVCFSCAKLLRVVEDDPPYVVCSDWRVEPRTSPIAY